PSGVQGVCPDGWHLPSNMEWTELKTYISNDGYQDFEASALKAIDGWFDNGSGNNIYGFNALGGGFWDIEYNFFDDMDIIGYWWASNLAFLDIFFQDNNLRDPYSISQTWANSQGYSVRCIKD
ncbi:MAG TPA: FISUMP domain-containing protein, partial [Draconibacterium sp.]|nr:FISUMP domain-containing protein [Draconibacterium sp.]